MTAVRRCTAAIGILKRVSSFPGFLCTVHFLAKMACVMRAGGASLRGLTARLVKPTALPAAPARGVACRFFSDKKYTKTHEWLSADGVMGISDYAQGALGEVVYCDLPSEGATFKAKETICTLESVKAVGEVYAPADCEVVAVNDKLSDEPAMVNSSPEQDGWLVKLKLSGEPADMIDSVAYAKHVEAESAE
eukprot:TRINITY_DN822_c0_g4_i1.p2 TRINITY_DN822_c0_g4~~TRINITY_DN822_c0_g4_i1.p2  ORF type:complete len:192 (+),score=55.39 TRINITY_DN822_c0_g4_i1:118-693(+)